MEESSLRKGSVNLQCVHKGVDLILVLDVKDKIYGSECSASGLSQQEEPAETTSKTGEKVNRTLQCPNIVNTITDIQLLVKKQNKNKTCPVDNRVRLFDYV